MMGEIDFDKLGTPAVALLASATVSGWYWWRKGWHSWPAVWRTIVAGLVVARLTFVLLHTPEYMAEPLSILNVTDGGFSDTAGLLAALAVGAHCVAKNNIPRRPVVVATLAGAVVWIAGVIAKLDFGPPSTPVPVVELRRLDGTPVHLNALSGKPLVINLWASWCPPCRREMPAMRDAQRRYPDVTFVFANQGEDAATIQAFMAQQGLVIDNVLIDRERELGRLTGSFAMPTTLFYGTDGRLFLRHVGEIDRAGLGKRINMLVETR
jgi:thiol-disulfide isomerase/thioredoxin